MKIDFPKDLVNAISENEAIAVIGSGLSLSSGLLTWKNLLLKLVSSCKNHIVSHNKDNGGAIDVRRDSLNRLIRVFST